MKEKSVVLDQETVSRSLVRMAHEIIEKNKGVGN
ncbi:MAG: bifunctional pyr operon transcriptional regulator/uracil phosphoribosyltransferase, partial [Candidatus Omnitrophica bacterium]|nr:bifunctional pyr operon transcriptional regulator/uracil phosphoribosyltransferase [Candidatus Omnitrophota bacterium]